MRKQKVSKDSSENSEYEKSKERFSKSLAQPSKDFQKVLGNKKDKKDSHPFKLKGDKPTDITDIKPSPVKKSFSPKQDDDLKR